MLSTAADPTDATAFRQLLESCGPKPRIADSVRPELCPALAEIILGRMQSDRGRKMGSINVGGWKSGEDFFAWSDAPVQALREVLVEVIGGRSLVGWAMVNRAGSQHPRHQHRVAILTGIYYVAAGNAEARTPTVFECPCDERLARSSPRYELEVEPHPGRLVVCRGETWHRVPRCSGDEPRITVAFDIRR
jgi:hypothetical protein